MTLSELLEYAQDLVDSGFGSHEVIKATDDEGNSFIPIGTIQLDKAIKNRRDYDVVAEEDYDDYEDDLVNVIVIW